jgi:hypothetical protein
MVSCAISSMRRDSDESTQASIEVRGRHLGLLSAHGAHHVQQNQQIAAQDWAGEARTWEAMKHHMYVIADVLGAGIAKQFPDKF